MAVKAVKEIKVVKEKVSEAQGSSINKGPRVLTDSTSLINSMSSSTSLQNSEISSKTQTMIFL